MKNKLKRKLTIIVEKAKNKHLSKDILASIRDLEQKIEKAKGLKLSFTLNDKYNNAVETGEIDNLHFSDFTSAKKPKFVSPENWEYWPG